MFFQPPRSGPLHFNWFLVQNLLGNSSILKPRYYVCFASQKRGVSLQHAKHAGHISSDFYCKIYWEYQKYFEHAMQVNF